jgi:hypothetical protein
MFDLRPATKRSILDAVRKTWKNRVTTVLVGEAHTAKKDWQHRKVSPDITIASIRDLARALRRYNSKSNRDSG